MKTKARTNDQGQEKRPDKTREPDNKPDKAVKHETRQDKTRQDKTRQKTRQVSHMARGDKSRLDDTRQPQDKTITRQSRGVTTQHYTSARRPHDKTGQDNNKTATRQDKPRQETMQRSRQIHTTRTRRKARHKDRNDKERQNAEKMQSKFQQDRRNRGGELC